MKVLLEAIKQFITDFTESEELAHDRMTIGDQFIYRLKPNLNFLTKCRPFIKSEAFLIDYVKRVARDMTYDNLRKGFLDLAKFQNSKKNLK